MMDYASWLRRANAFVEVLRELPGEVRIEQHIAPPLSDDEIDRLAKQSRLPIPVPLRRFWREAAASCRCTYQWITPPDFQEQLRIASPDRGFESIWGGIEMDKPQNVVALLDSCVDWAEHFRADFPKDARFYNHSIPLFPVPNGDYVGLYVRDDATNPPVAYLCHDGYGGSGIISESFDDFIARWELLRYVGIDFFRTFQDRRKGILEPSHFPTELLALQSMLEGVHRNDLVRPSLRFDENDWLIADNPAILTDWLEKSGAIDERKVRLYCCACCRRVWQRLGDSSRRAVEVSERFSDGFASAAELAEAREALAGPSLRRFNELQTEMQSGLLALIDPTQPADEPMQKLSQWSEALFQQVQFGNSEGQMHSAAYCAVDARMSVSWDIVQHLDEPELSLEMQAHCDLLRHIFGNPFRPQDAHNSFSSRLKSLASDLYFGSDCKEELRSALVEERHIALAEHFREPTHPKGCWALDLILSASH